MMYKFEIKDIYTPSTAYQSLHDTIGNDTYPLGRTTTSSVYSSITHNNTDYRMDPSTGMINSFSMEYAGLGGDNKFARLITDHTYFHPIYKRLIASTKLTLGYIGEVGQTIPIDEKFYLGGIYSLRGYRSRTVAPTDTVPVKNNYGYQTSQQLYLGGDTEVFGNIEVTVPLLPEAGLKGVMFFDYGNSVNSTSAVFDTMLMSYGYGIRWASPIGPLRLEYGIPINPRKEIDSTSGRLEFSIGSMF